MHDPRPPFRANDAVLLARELYGLDAAARELEAELDRNFLLLSPEGDRFVLKVSPAGASRAELEGQIAVLDFLQGSALAGRLPRALPSREGRGLASWRREDHDFPVRLYSFLPGRRWVDCHERPRSLHRQLGRFLARLDQTLEGFEHPAARREHPWDLTRLLEHREASAAIPSDGRRGRVDAILERFRRHVVPALPSLRRSAIHNDANDYNVLVTEASPPALAGLIDFGDLVASVTVAELAVACAYAMLDREDPWRDAAEIVAGYDAVRPLSPLERRLLPDLVEARLALSLLMSHRRRRQMAENAYLAVSEEPIWRLLEVTAGLPTRNREERLFAACPSSWGLRRKKEEILSLRRRHLGRNLSISYDRPLKIVRGDGARLYDEDGRSYLDLVNNVCHVGHCHPRVVAAIQRQAALLNTNTRYLHDHLVEYARRLAATFPEPLSVCYFVCSGSEANDLALRLARAHTGSRDVVVLDHAYHGNSPTLIEISPYKCQGRGGEGLAAHAHKVPLPDPYRGVFRGSNTGSAYAGEVGRVVGELAAEGRRLGAFLAESLPGCAGQIVLPEGFLAEAFEIARAAGAVCIADEVQVGFGRVGSHTWAFELGGVSPDIVTLGKPIGNGHPLAAVVTTPEIAASFDNGMEYFNTFGGNPVSCAAGLAVLDVVEDEELQRHALETGDFLLEGLKEIAGRHEWVGDVRGRGLFVGIELVRDRATREPAADEAHAVVQALKERAFLVSTDGPDHNVLKLKPPLVVSRQDLAAFLEALDEVLTRQGGSS